MKAATFNALAIGWQSERFARTKHIKTPQHWLKAAEPRNPDSEAHDVRMMFERRIKRQEDEDGSR